jgi:glucokinase
MEARVILAGDVGATKILLEVGEVRSGRWEPAFARRYSARDVANFPDVLHAFLSEWDPVRPPGHGFVSAAFGAAGVAEGNKVKMTHHPWAVDGDMIALRFPIPKVKVVNDLAAAAHGVEWLAPDELIEIQPGKSIPGEPRVVIGVGTGLGVSYCVRVNGVYHEIAGEGGHANFGPASPAQAGLWSEIFTSHGRVSDEDVLSGSGLQHIYAYTAGLGAHAAGQSEMPRPEEISAGAIERGDAKCTKALDLFAECLGNVAGDHALSIMARGGVYLTGGIVAKVVSWLQHEHFRQAFCAKAPHSATMMRIPVYAVTTERIAVIGAARYATEEFEQGSAFSVPGDNVGTR